MNRALLAAAHAHGADVAATFNSFSLVERYVLADPSALIVIAGPRLQDYSREEVGAFRVGFLSTIDSSEVNSHDQS